MSADESVTNYFSYVKNVLGVRNLHSERIRQSLLEASQPLLDLGLHHRALPWTQVHAQGMDVIFLNLRAGEEQSIFAPESFELLEKMTQAMRLGDRKFLVVEAPVSAPADMDLKDFVMKLAEKSPKAFVVFFSAAPSVNGIIKSLGVAKFLETFSPVYLLQNAAAKKVAWNDLQKVMKEIGVKV